MMAFLSQNLTSKSNPLIRLSCRLTSIRSRSGIPRNSRLVEIEIGEVEVEDAEADFIGNIKKIDDVIHGIVVRGSAPCWLPFRPGSSYWVPPKRKGQTRGLERLIGRLSNPMNQEEMMSLTTIRGWPSSSFFVGDKDSPSIPIAENQETNNGKSDVEEV
ncbi:hypothetical protein ZOSMA_202G00450 [Zostera marina]|uniref:Uncharacterized protein n=1 Tax=Zostera marina TaxID=29655 RepID=A0A0K9PLK8_ZOSMR|nr:hypothetical protein ZOSMA_202G00450 [Zostera marina]